MAAPLIAIEIVVGFGLPLLWGVGQLLSLRRERKRDAEKAAAAEPSGPGESPPHHPKQGP